MEEETKTTKNQKIPRPTPTPRRAGQTPRLSPVLSIDGRLGGGTEADKARNNLLDLVESLKSAGFSRGLWKGSSGGNGTRSTAGRCCTTGTLRSSSGRRDGGAPRGPAGQAPGGRTLDLLNKRMGAEVDYVVKAWTPKAGVAAASRLEAMALKRREYYFTPDREGNYRLYGGVCAEGRVVSAIRPGIFVDLFGVEVYIPLAELSYQRMLDATAAFQAGQRVLVKILAIDRTDRDHIRVRASVKQAGENPYEKALRRYSVGNRYVGTVSMVDTTGVFVALDGGVDCLCSYPKRGRPPRGARVTVRILGINQETNRIWGVIVHIAVPH